MLLRPTTAHACTHVLRRLQTYQLCNICCVPALAMAMWGNERRPYQMWNAWDTYGTAAWWAKVFANPTHVLELVALRLHSGGLVCPSEKTSAHIAAGIIVLTHGDSSAMVDKDECDKVFLAFKVRRMIMRASHHTSYIKHQHCGGNRNQ